MRFARRHQAGPRRERRRGDEIAALAMKHPRGFAGHTSDRGARGRAADGIVWSCPVGRRRDMLFLHPVLEHGRERGLH